MGEYLLSVEKHCAKGMGYVAFFCGLSFFFIAAQTIHVDWEAMGNQNAPKKTNTENSHYY